MTSGLLKTQLVLSNPVFAALVSTGSELDSNRKDFAKALSVNGKTTQPWGQANANPLFLLSWKKSRFLATLSRDLML
jgi:DNA-binding transcriptional regulator YiaG